MWKQHEGDRRLPPPAEPLVTTQLGKKEVEFLVDTGASYSVLNTLEGLLNQEIITVIGAMGVEESHPFFKPIKFHLGKHWVTHQFLYLTNLPKAREEIYWK